MLTEREPFRVIPAVDLLGEEAVRLERGDFDRVTTREADPLALVERLVAAGATLIHLVDLDAARTGTIRPALVRRIVVAARPAAVQAAGGVRSQADAETLLDAGAVRVVVGTAAFAEPGALEGYAARLEERLVVAIDVRNGLVAAEGWERTTKLKAEEAAERCTRAGVQRLLCTAIERDGTLAGPAIDLLARIRASSGLPVLAAGGVRSVADLFAIEAAGCEAAIVGRALLEGILPTSILAASPFTW